MSRSNPNEQLVNPAARFYEWSGSNGNFKYYDKELKQNVDVPLPFTFLVLDTCATVKGFNDANQGGYWSNEVKDIRKDLITVRSKKGLEMTGTWEQIKAKMAADGVEYCQSVYIGIKMDGKNLGLANIQMRGSALSSWIEFCKTNKIMECAVTVKSATPAKKGATKYFEPKFEAVKIKEETNLEAIELDKTLQEYLKAYFERNATAPTETPAVTNNAPVATETVNSSKSNLADPAIKNAIIQGVDSVDTNEESGLPF